jgi:hypothetical protein
LGLGDRRITTSTAAEDAFRARTPLIGASTLVILRRMLNRVRIGACIAVVSIAWGTGGALLASALLPAASRAEERDEAERWVPSLALSSGVFGQEAEGSLRSGTFTNRLGQTETLRPPAEGDDLILSAYINGSLELMTPGLVSLPGKPRLFVHGGGGASFGTERDLAKEGAPGSFSPGGGFNQSEASITGQGSTTTAEVELLNLSAGAGIAFTLDVFERRVRVKPSLEYFRETVEVSGLVNRAIRSTLATNVPTEFVFVSLQADETKVHQGLGGGLEIELDAARAGPFLLSVFAGGQVLRVLGDRDVSLRASRDIDDPVLGQQTLDASWEYEGEPWIYRGGVGLRFRWLPE